MSETNNLFSAAMAAIGMVLSEFYAHLAPWLLLGMVIVLVDLRFGILAAKKSGHQECGVALSIRWWTTFVG